MVHDLVTYIKQKQLTQYILDIMEWKLNRRLFTWIIFLAVQSFLLALIALMVKKFAWKPILNSVEEREAGIRRRLSCCRRMRRKKCRTYNASNEQLLKDARAERDALMKDARDIKDKMISDAKEEAKEVTAKLIDNALSIYRARKTSSFSRIKKSSSRIIYWYCRNSN